MDKKIALVIPTYNEVLNIKPLIQRIRESHSDIPVYFIDSNSTDLTQNEIQKYQKTDLNIHLLQQPKKIGLGLAYIEAFFHLIQNTSITHIIIMDADLSHEPEEICHFIDKSNTYDIVIGSRVINSTLFQPESFIRNFISKCINFYAHRKLQLPIKDYSSGFIMFPLRNVENYLHILKRTKGYIFQAHLKYALFRTTSSHVEIPIFFKKRIAGKSKLSLHTAVEALLMTQKIPSYYSAK